MVNILSYTDKNPLTFIGEVAGICWNSDISNNDKNIKRAIDCILSGHGRVEEYPDVVMEISGYSARCIRELYTHIVGTTRLQESTRYVDCENFGYFMPSGMNPEAAYEYESIMENIRESYKKLLSVGVSKEDAANVLPLGMYTKIVWKINLRGLIHFIEMRTCSRAYKEIRQLSGEIIKALSSYSGEWKYIADNFLKPKCEHMGFCNEKKSCGRYEAKNVSNKGES